MTTMDFRSYEKISDNLRAWNVDENTRKELDKTEWVVTEKVHGANFSVIIKDKTLHFGKRKELLTWEDDFFAFQLMVTRLERAFYRVFDICQEKFQATSCILYGELFGGGYPHQAVLHDERLQPIQTGIYYSPHIEFYVFDIWIENTQEACYVAYHDFCEVLAQTPLLYASALAIDALHKVLLFDTKINSHIPALLGLPALPQPSWIEGIVIKPLQNIVINTPKGNIRPVIKIKNKQFLEEDVYHQSQAWSFVPTEKQADIAFVATEVAHFLNMNRLQSAISKIGALNSLNKERIIEAVIADSLESFEEQNPNFLHHIHIEALAQVKNILWKQTDELCAVYGRQVC